MDIYSLRSFIVLTEQLHFGRAARVLNLSQPALTKQIHRMEEELGGELFERGRHGTSLSALGKEFLVHARDVVHRFDQLLEIGRKAAAGEVGQLRIGFGFHTLELVPRVIVRLRRESPGVLIELRDMSTAEQVAALEEGRLDIGFVRLSARLSKDYTVRPVVSDRLALVLPEDMAEKNYTSLGDFRNESFIAISQKRSPGFYHHMLTLCARHGFHPRVVQEVTEFTSALALVRSGMGVAMIPASFIGGKISGVRTFPLCEDAAAWSVGAAWRKDDANPVLQRFLRLLPLEAEKPDAPARAKTAGRSVSK